MKRWTQSTRWTSLRIKMEPDLKARLRQYAHDSGRSFSAEARYWTAIALGFSQNKAAYFAEPWKFSAKPAH